MAPSEKKPFYDPVPPTYDEALASSSRQDADWPHPRSSVDDDGPNDAESQSLLHRSNGAPSSSRRPHGYHPPTVESDHSDSDIESLLESDSDEEEAAQVRREMQEMDVEEPSSSRGLLWGKRIGFSLPRWKWSWRPRLPSLPRVRLQLPSRRTDSEDDNANEDQSSTETRPTWNIPRVNSMVAVIMFARLLAAFIVLGFVYLLFASDFLNSFGGPLGGGLRFNAEELRIHLLSSVDPMHMRASVQHFSSYAHMAGTEGGYDTANDMAIMFGRASLEEVKTEKYIAYINYPREDGHGRAVQIMDGNNDKAIWTAKLEEEERGEETAGHQTYVFHGHSKSGDVKGPLIYANHGSRKDFQKLKDKGVKTDGAIALVRDDGTIDDHGSKVKAAEMAGFAGCIVYGEPAHDGFDKDKVAPHGRFMPADGVQRGSVSLTNWVVGDVMTPGWASNEGVPRIELDDDPVGLVKIPSLPLAWRDAQVLLQHLKGHGEKVPKGWTGTVPGIDEWWTGNASSPVVRLQNEQVEDEKRPIWNVYGKIRGMEQSAKSIIIGNHRDAWAFGAADPHSGTAIMVEMARIFGDLLLRGWRPLRTIEFMSWDAGEYNLIGSTEFVENTVDSLRENAYAYINLDKAVTGSEFHASGSPVFRKTLLHALNRIADPNLNETLRELWDGGGNHIEGLGVSGDYVAFQDIAGTSSLDLEFRGQRYPFHSSYDNFEFVEKVIDPEFTYHGLMAQVVGLLILDLADKAIMPFDLSAYGEALGNWVSDLDTWAQMTTDDSISLNFKELRDAVGAIQRNAAEFSKWEDRWDQLLLQSAGWESSDVGAARSHYNNIMGNFDAALLDLEGGVSHALPANLTVVDIDSGVQIPKRDQFKHVVFGPQLWPDVDEVHVEDEVYFRGISYFPAIRDTIREKQWGKARKLISKTARILNKAASTLIIEEDEKEGGGGEKEGEKEDGA